MITKSAELYLTNNQVFGSDINVKGYNTGYLEIMVPENVTAYVSFYASVDGQPARVANNHNFDIWDGYNVKATNNFNLSAAGIYKYKLDLTGITNLYITVVGGELSGSLNLQQNAFIKPSHEFNKFLPSGRTNLDVSNYNTGYLRVVVDDSTVTFGCTVKYKDADTAVPARMYNGNLCILGNQSLNQAGEYRYKIDLTNVSIFTITGPSENLCLELSSEAFAVDEGVCTCTGLTNIDTTGINSLHLKVITTSIAEGTSPYIIVIDSNSAHCSMDTGSRIVTQLNLEVGIQEIDVDCYSTDSVSIRNVSGGAAVYLLNVTPVNRIVDKSKDTKNGLLKVNGDYILLDDGTKQVEFTATGQGRIKVEGSNDDFATTTFIKLYDMTNNKLVNSNYAQLTTNGIKIFANVEGFTKVRILNIQNYETQITDYVCHKDYKEGLRITLKPDRVLEFYKGYKWFKINFLSSAIINGTATSSIVEKCSAYIKFSTVSATTIKYYNRGLKRFNDLLLDPSYGVVLQGTPSGGGYIVELPVAISESTMVSCSITHSTQTLAGYTAAALFDLECYTQAPDAETALEKEYERGDYTVYKLPSESMNRDVLNYDVLEWSSNELTYYWGGYLGIKYTIPFGADNVNHFVSGETISFAYLLPMNHNIRRDDNVGTDFGKSRIVVFTKSRVFHNFPLRGTTANPQSDCQLFDESAVYMKDRAPKWPTNDKSKVDALHRYFPVLKEYDYDQFEGRLPGTTGYVDVYGNGGFLTDRTLMDIPVSNVQFYDRLRYSNLTKGPKICAFGNYNGYPGSAPFVMTTSNGGRTWWVTANFAGTDYYSNMYGSKIDLTPISSVAAYQANSLKMCRKRFNVPTVETKEPETPFIINEEDKALVASFSTYSDGTVLVNLASELNYDGVNPIVYFENVSAESEWNYICNNGFTADGTVNNGIFFRVIKVSNTQYRLYADLGNPYDGDKVCRHIHAVNTVEAGVLISTGESYSEDWYEGGFLYLIVQNQRNGGHSVSAGALTEVIRLGSTTNGVNRACGAYIFSDNADPTLLYVSDESFVVKDNHKRYADIPGRTVQYPCTPAGVFVGKLSDIDDQTKFRCVCELQTTMIGLLESHGHFAADGHSNAICLSKNGFDWTVDVYDNSVINGSDNYGNIYFGNKVVVFK